MGKPWHHFLHHSSCFWGQTSLTEHRRKNQPTLRLHQHHRKSMAWMWWATSKHLPHAHTHGQKREHAIQTTSTSILRPFIHSSTHPLEGQQAIHTESDTYHETTCTQQYISCRYNNRGQGDEEITDFPKPITTWLIFSSAHNIPRQSCQTSYQAHKTQR